MENVSNIMNSAVQIYYYIALFATILFVIKTIVFITFGGDSGSEIFADFNTEIDTDPSFNFLSFQTVLAFFMGFGWMGYAALVRLKLSQLYSLLSALGMGLVFMFVTAFLMLWAKKLEKNVKQDKKTALNKKGKAYTDFAPKGTGQIEIEINGKISVVDAENLTEEEVKAFDTITVTKVENETIYIKKEQ